ncbi:hypothetical protein V8E52_005503 [Russula decolorans]
MSRIVMSSHTRNQQSPLAQTYRCFGAVLFTRSRRSLAVPSTALSHGKHPPTPARLLLSYTPLVRLYITHQGSPRFISQIKTYVLSQRYQCDLRSYPPIQCSWPDTGRKTGGLQCRLVRRRPRSPRALPSSSRPTTYGPATTYRGLQPRCRGPRPQGRASGEWCRACRRERAMVSHEMGGYSDRHRHHSYHWCHRWRRSRRHTSQLQQKRRQPQCQHRWQP